MFRHNKIKEKKDFFKKLNDRKPRGVYFYRINQYSDDMKSFIIEYYNKAKIKGIIIEGGINNPDKNNLDYYREKIGEDFEIDKNLICEHMKYWLPRIKPEKRKILSDLIYIYLKELSDKGKNKNILKNTYIKFMCWLYYKFEHMLNFLGDNEVPKIIYEGRISKYELAMLGIISKAGCDIIILQYEGDEFYKNLDPLNMYSYNMIVDNGSVFPDGFNMKNLIKDINNKNQIHSVTNTESIVLKRELNTWIKKDFLYQSILEDYSKRGSDKSKFYNAFCIINGTNDRMNYQEELYSLYISLKKNKNVLIFNKEIDIPNVSEIGKIKRKKYTNKEEMIIDLSRNIYIKDNIDLQNIARKSFIDIFLEYDNEIGNDIKKLYIKAVYVLCWINRYLDNLIRKWKNNNVNSAIFFGESYSDSEWIFINFLTNMPIDVIVINPKNINLKNVINTNNALVIVNDDYSDIEEFPISKDKIIIKTVAYQAERELNNLLYDGKYIYRDKQYNKAITVNLQTTYEELNILWNVEMKYRKGFNIIGDTVIVPVIFAKVSGVKYGNINMYWNSIKQLIDEDVLIIKNEKYIDTRCNNPIKAYATKFYKNKKLQRKAIKSHSSYRYTFLRDEVQDYILEKIEFMINKEIIAGTFENGTEYMIISTLLNLNNEVLRLIQKFDFTKKNPKLIYINTKEDSISKEDSILIVFLSIIGFDVIFFIPTGYQSIERYIKGISLCEHQVGEYKYNLQVPDLSGKKIEVSKIHLPWINKIIRRCF